MTSKISTNQKTFNSSKSYKSINKNDDFADEKKIVQSVPSLESRFSDIAEGSHDKMVANAGVSSCKHNDISSTDDSVQDKEDKMDIQDLINTSIKIMYVPFIILNSILYLIILIDNSHEHILY